MRKILCILWEYPQISETYIETEIRALKCRFDVHIVSMNKPNLEYEHHFPYQRAKDVDELISIARKIDPDILHGHYMFNIRNLFPVARALDIPFTVRSHSLDVLGASEKNLPGYRKVINSSYCAGVLGFPFMMETFLKAGFHRDKIHPCFPVIEYDWFYDRSPNGEGVMNVGACIPKKNMESFVELGRLVPEKKFDLYALGYYRDDIRELNESLGSPISILPTIEPRDMPREYKKHEWMVYTGTPKLPTVGWPLAIAEAQAAGVGVCMQRVRPDLEDYVGDAGYVFDDIEEVKDIISQPVPEEIREKGFIQARKSDIHGHIDALISFWRQAYKS